jgi:site-specific recombinase XerD
MRVTEVAMLRHEDLLFLDGKRALLIHAKGGKRLQRALSDCAATALDAYLGWRAEQLGIEPGALQGPLFVGNKGNALTRDTLARIVQSVAALAALPVNVTPHVLRHTFATIATEEGADLDDLQSAMGHADPRTTRRYQRAASRLANDPAHRVSQALG